MRISDTENISDALGKDVKYYADAAIISDGSANFQFCLYATYVEHNEELMKTIRILFNKEDMTSYLTDVITSLFGEIEYKDGGVFFPYNYIDYTLACKKLCDYITEITGIEFDGKKRYLYGVSISCNEYDINEMCEPFQAKIER